jgi:hypothetical protein
VRDFNWVILDLCKTLLSPLIDDFCAWMHLNCVGVSIHVDVGLHEVHDDIMRFP